MTAKPGIYEPLGLDDCELCHPVNSNDFERIRVELNGIARKSGWTPVPMQLIGFNDGKPLARSDSPWLSSHNLIFRSQAVVALKPILLRNGELLPLKCAGAELVVYNPMRVDDAFDEAASSVRRFDSGRIMRIERHVFRASAMEGKDAFMIPNLRVSPTYVSHRFVDQWHAAGLRGLEFTCRWGSDD